MHTGQHDGSRQHTGTGQHGDPARRRPLVVALTALVLGLTGCADVDGRGTDLTAGGRETVDRADAHAPMLSIHRSGGFVLVGTDFASVPEVTVYPDGLAITHGPQIAIFPPPALPNLLRQELDDDVVASLVAAARAAGLLDEVAPGYGHPPVADAPTTVVTLRVDGRTYEHTAEALGLGDGAQPSPEGEEVGELLPGLTPDERAARAELAAFIARVHDLVGAPNAEQYRIDAFAVMARPVADDAPPDDALPEDALPDDRGPDEAAAGGTQPAIDEPARPVLAWPIDVALADARDCVLVEGAAARTLHDALVGASSAAVVEQDGVRYDVWLRPLLPHEDGCADV